jgi:Tfp pilus assembly protein PilF
LFLTLGWQTGCLSLDPALPLKHALESGSQQRLAETHAGRAKELPPNQTAELCLAAAAELEKRGFESEAIAQYEKAREHDPNRKQVAYRLAVLYDRRGDSTRAAAEYARALQETPRNADLLNDLGYFHYQRDNFVEAEKWFRQALAVTPGHQRAAVNLGLALGCQGRFQESLETFAKILPPAQALSNVGVLLAQQGRKDEAREAFQQALRLEPGLPQARAIMARLDGLPSPAEASANPLATAATAGVGGTTK